MREDFNVLCPGHGPPVWDAQSKLEQYAAHRIDRENRLITALGRRPAHDRGAARHGLVGRARASCARPPTATLAAHLDKLEEEQALPPGVERPRFERAEW